VSDDRDPTVLLVEDEAKTAEAVQRGLTAHGFSVTVATTAAAARNAVATARFAVAVLDIGLPDGDGFTLLEALRNAGHQGPVLFLTARDAVSDRVRGLELGADDYLVKPFAFSELLARLRVLLRRGTATGDSLRVADLTLDLVRRRAERGGQRIELSAIEFALLAVLVRHAGEPLSRRELARQVWDMQVDSGTNVVDVAVRRLRAQVDEPFPTQLIHTVRGVGYVCARA